MHVASDHQRAPDRSMILQAVSAVLAADRRGALVAVALQLLGAAAALGVVAASRLALQGVLGDEAATAGSLVLALLTLALATAASSSVSVLQQQQQRLLGERVAQRVWDRLLTACSAVPLISYESASFNERLDRVSENALERPYGAVTGLLGAGGAGISVCAMAAALLSLEPLLVPVLLLAGLPAVVLARRASRAEFAFVTAATPVWRRRSYLRDLLSERRSAAELRSFDASSFLLARHAADGAEFLAMLRRHVRRRQGYSLLTVASSGLALAAALLGIVALVRAGELTLADAGAATIAARLLGTQLSILFASFGTLTEAGPFLHDFEEFMAEMPPPGPRGSRRELRHDVTAESVTFTYAGRERPALDRVSIKLRRGQVVALVGENGSGKTTLAKITAGLYEPDSGRLLWDGAPLPLEDLRASVGVLLQDFMQYQMSVMDNIAISDTSTNGDRDRVEAAVRRAGITPLVEALPQGLDTVLGRELAEGSDLSGGQWQRLGLARALYRDATLMIFDEPTAALDPRAEHELFSDLKAMLAGRSALLITHRYSSVRLADYIYVLDEGRVIEEGTHDQLIAVGGHYAELYALQAAAYLP